MSDSATKQRPTIDLDEFERRLRQTAPMRDDDPLAELARLVGEQPDPYGDVFARQPVGEEPHYDGRREPAAQSASRRLNGDFAAIEAGLRGVISPHEPQHHESQLQSASHAYAAHEQGYGASPDEQTWADQAGYVNPAYAHDAPPRASRRPLYIIAASIAVGVVGIGAAFALKSHVGTSPREVKTIMADAGPTKIQPAADASADHAQQDSAMTGGNAAQQPTKLVSREEQPVELSQAVQDNAARAPMTNGSDAASVAVPLSPDQAAAAGGAVTETQGFAADVAPKHVKVVSVRPDGTPIVDDQPPEAAMPAPRQAPAATSDRAGPVAKTSTPKSTSRVATTPKTIAALAGDATDSAGMPTAKPAKSARKAKPQHVAMAEPTAAPADANDGAGADAPKPAVSAGGFAVQLAAPGTEAEAKSASARLGKKFAAALGGRHLGFHKADSNGRSVYRVRVSSLTREDAVGLCEKLKADGGQCFVAKN